MNGTLSREHRRCLENTIAAARIDAEGDAEKALQALAVGAAALPSHLSPGQRALRVRLREPARRLASLRAEVFDTDDSLGWSYQFWQAPRKEAVQRQVKNAGTKVGADELPAVTQLFTEPYMVAFLLENALGAWWHRVYAGKPLPLPLPMPYLRFAPLPPRRERSGVRVANPPPAP